MARAVLPRATEHEDWMLTGRAGRGEEFPASAAVMEEEGAKSYVAGEVKVGVTLHLLAGSNAVDLGVIFDTTPDTCITIMYEVLLHCVIKKTLVIPI